MRLFERFFLRVVKAWIALTTPEKKGCSKRVHITRGSDNKLRKLVVYYSNNGRLPQYEVVP
ncbi:MAG: hypothetical protein HYT72_04580 [Candidatus Aenigmarchaeota archaeon]|nr:hypothetical protein [Candidatus Aenigmarchaeota archaeon]